MLQIIWKNIITGGSDDLESGKLNLCWHGNYFFFFLLILLCYLNVAEDEEEFTICQDGDDDREKAEYQVKLSRIVIDKACLLILLCC